MKYTVKVIETRVMEMEIEANSEEQAIAMVEDDYFENIAEYDSHLDLDDTNFEIVNCEEEEQEDA